MIFVGDTKLFLMAIFGIKGNKRMGLDEEYLADFDKGCKCKIILAQVFAGNHRH